MCTGAIVPGRRLVLYSPANTGTNQCVFRIYHTANLASGSFCSPTVARTVAACNSDPFPAPPSSVQ
jgi:hypothetical protein